MTHQFGRTPADSELADHLGVPEADVLEARRAHQVFTAHCLDAPNASSASWCWTGP